MYQQAGMRMQQHPEMDSGTGKLNAPWFSLHGVGIAILCCLLSYWDLVGSESADLITTHHYYVMTHFNYGLAMIEDSTIEDAKTIWTFFCYDHVIFFMANCRHPPPLCPFLRMSWLPL